ncbi:hemolysin family protein [Jatrophihabitans telluris]|uniref:Hemolysin family protein n=1 Tax=Jatrophihabitans telluris TaxID=2038343 RepID=A0ABY4QWU9_9ACTN|nr:hemolysin family protein [Jatrophihabitans telluris]UQX87824.1 hemolysin family protein [Jatrophihabitans telluris]
MNGTLLNVAIVLGLIVVEGLFVAAEIALVSLREGQAKALAETGRRGQSVARLLSDPNRFLAAVQIGVTSTALLSSAFGAVTLSEAAKQALIERGVGKTLAGVIGIVGVTLVISLVTLVLGELAPKRLGLQRPENTALFFGPTLDRMARLLRPVIWMLSASTNGVVRILGGDPKAGRDMISEEELRGLVAAHESLSSDERRLIDDVFAAGERTVSHVMISRTEVTFLEGGTTISRAARLAGDSPHSRYPVTGQSNDDVLGFVHIRDLILGAPGVDPSHDRARVVADLVRDIKVLPGSKNVLAALSEMRREGHHMAIVVDEYGGTDGIVTLEDLIEEIIGDIRDEYDNEDDESRRLTGGVVELDARLNLDEFASYTGLELPEGPYETVAGFVMARLGRLPKVGDEVTVNQRLLQVIEVDGRRTARIRVQPLPSADSGADPASAGPERPAQGQPGSDDGSVIHR